MGQETSPQTDLYALGVMLYEMCTSKLPFAGDNPLSIISQHINAPVVAPSRITSEIPAEIDDLILRLMSKSPSDRPSSAEEVGQYLRSDLHSEGVIEPDDLISRSRQNIAHNLPVQLTSFVGREQEIAEIRQLDRGRLLPATNHGRTRWDWQDPTGNRGSCPTHR